MDLIEARQGSSRRHPWEWARAGFFVRVLRDAGVLDARRSVLDVGAGDGYLAGRLLEALPEGSAVACVDSNYRDEDLAAAPPHAGISFAREVPARRFDLLLLLDVVEHVPDGAAFLRGLIDGHLAPGGLVLVSVPAWQALFSTHDEALKHYLRYSPAACRRLLESVGLSLRRSGGLFHSLLLPRALSVAGERLARALGRTPAVPANLGQWGGGAALTAALRGALAVDNAVSHAAARLGAPLPGLSFWALCDGPAGGQA